MMNKVIENKTIENGKYRRPVELSGFTWQIALPDQHKKLYVTVNHDGHRIVEVFLKGTVSNGVGILASTLLQLHYPLNEVCRKLNSVTGTHYIVFEGAVCTSEEQIAARALQITAQKLEV